MATKSIPKGGLIFVERPLCSLQSLGNAHTGALVCRYCRAYTGGPELCLLVASGSVPRHAILDYHAAAAGASTKNNQFSSTTGSTIGIVPCRNACGEIYCSTDCEQDFWHSGGHSLLCTGSIQEDGHPLLAFKKHAMEQNEIFLLVADVIVRILADPTNVNTTVESFTDFTMVPWWTVTCEPLLRASNPMGFAEAAILEKSMRTMCEESACLLRNSLDLPHHHPYVNALFFAKLIGSFEQNSMGIRNRHPLCREIFNVELRRTFRHDVIQCLAKAGMIAGEECVDDDCADEECGGTENEDEDGISDCNGQEETTNDNVWNNNDETTGNGKQENETHNTKIPEQWDYSNDEIAVFLACLSMEEFSTDGDDLDALFNPLDGTAMFSTACKMNHSCDPNVVVLYRTRNWGEPLAAHMVAVKDICAGEELCISYIEAWETLENRTKALADYGFVCQCAKCESERNGNQYKEGIEKIVNEDALLFGDDDGSENDQENLTMQERDSESLLQRLAELNEKLNENNLGRTPMMLLGEASSFAVRVAALSIDGLDTKGDDNMATSLQSCINSLNDRNIVACQQLGSQLAMNLFQMLQEHGSWSHPAYRSALVASSVVAAIGFCHVGSFLEAQRLLDRAMVLGLPRQEVSGFVDFVEHFANQMARGPLAPALEGQILDYNMKELKDMVTQYGLSSTIDYPVLESPCDIELETFNESFVNNDTSTVFRGFAKDWAATQKWRNLSQLAHQHGHRIIPIELGSMMKEDGMKESLLSFRNFIANFLRPSSEKEYWSLADSQDRSSNTAYLAQHSLLSQIPELGEDVELCPYLCGNQGPSHINVWMGTGGTRTPLHFDSFDNLLVQVVGAKYVRVYSCDETDKLYCIKSNEGVSSQGNMSEVNCELEDWTRHPNASSAKYQEVLLLPGDCLFIPSGCWHYVRSLTTSISVNYWW